MIEYVSLPSNCFITRFRAAVSDLVGPCCPALLKIVSMQICVLLHYWANKMTMMMNYYKRGSYADEEAYTLGVHNHSVPTEEKTFITPAKKKP